MDEVQLQRNYYAETANQYDEMHANCDHEEHFLALSFLIASLDYLNIRSVLDIGSGTGRAIVYIKERCPGIYVIGVEPVKQLREVAYSKGISRNELIDGDATKLPYGASALDMVCEFGVLHHVPRPEMVVSEMLRVSRKAIFISDSNNFGHGTFLSRKIKQAINSVGLWRLADFIKTNGRGYTISECDGLAYSYSVFTNIKQIQSVCKSVHLVNTKGGGANPYRTASNVALLGIKK